MSNSVKLRGALGFVLKNFATPIAFYLTFQVWGSKPAIGFAVATTAIQILVHLFWRLNFTPFFAVASGFTVVLGMVDLFVATPRFYRLEPFAQNAVIGIAFLVTLFLRKPIALLFAAALPPTVRPALDDLFYLRKLTAIWGVYFLLKAALFLWIALHVDLGRLVLLRTIIGGGTMVALFAGEVAYRKLRWKSS